MFADEIKEDDEKFTPNPGINDSEVSSGILLPKLFLPTVKFFFLLIEKIF